MFDFTKKIVVVTGAARGIGKNISAKFSSLGARVVMIDINAKQLEKTVQDFRSAELTVDCLEFDLSKIDKIEEMVKGMFKKYGSIDILIHNARAGERTSPLSETLKNFDLSSEVFLKAPLFFSQAVIKETSNIPDPGFYQNRCILNISSVAAQNICKESAGYHLAKAASENLTRYLAVHGGPFGFRVNAIRPGFIVQDEHLKRYKSDGNKNYREMSEFCHPLRKIGYSDDIANAALFLCSDLAGFITGQVLAIDGGLTIQDQWDLINTYHQALEK